MGVSDCSIPFAVLEQWRNALMFQADGTPYDGVSTSGNVLSALTVEEPSRVWGKWSFGQNQGLFMYPYAWAAIDLDIKATYNPDCIPAYGPSIEIKCITV